MISEPCILWHDIRSNNSDIRLSRLARQNKNQSKFIKKTLDERICHKDSNHFIISHLISFFYHEKFASWIFHVPFVVQRYLDWLFGYFMLNIFQPFSGFRVLLFTGYVFPHFSVHMMKTEWYGYWIIEKEAKAGRTA